MSLTTDRNDPQLHETGTDGQNKKYLVLSEEERAKGFVRPVRHTYVHVGRKVESEGVIVTLEEGLIDHSSWAKDHYTEENGYAACIIYPENHPLHGRFIKKDEYDALMAAKEFVGGCGAVTTMGQGLAETYARDPKFYGATFCIKCGTHLPVNEFIWDADGEIVGS